jgi:hypothetical protein
LTDPGEFSPLRQFFGSHAPDWERVKIGNQSCMNDVLITIAISIITNGTLLGLFIWVFKRLFDNALTKRAEMFKKELELINKKNFYQFSKLYDEQAQVINEVYADLVDMLDKVQYLVYRYKLLEEHP